MFQFLGVTLWIPLALIFQKQILRENINFDPNVETAAVMAMLGLTIIVMVLLSIKDDD